jgi:hypothetical protein
VRYLVFILLFSTQAFAKTNDYLGMSFLDQNFRFGLGMSYSKLEANSDVGNYYLLSASNPRLDVSYDTGSKDNFRLRYSGYVLRELFRPENDSFRLKSRLEQTNLGIAIQPMWVTAGQGFSYGFKLGLKSAAIISEIPDIFIIDGDIATRYSAEGGFSFNWFGQTVSKFPLSIGLELLYSQGLFDNSVLTYYNGFIYRFSIEFDFKKKTLFDGWNVKGFYGYEDVQNGYSHTVDKELGLMLNKVWVF